MRNVKNNAPPIDRKKFTKWVTRYCKQNAALFRQLSQQINDIMEPYGFTWVEVSRDGIPAQITSIEFNNILENNEYTNVYILFDKYGKLQFSVSFAKYTLVNECKPVIMASFVKRQSELWSAKLWGARWYHFDKRAKFLSDWRKFEETIPHIVKFLEDGQAHPNIYVGYRRPDLA